MTKPKPIGEPITNYTLKTLTSFCRKNGIKLNNNYNNIRVTRDTKIHGKCLNLSCNNDFNKVFRQLMSTNGYCSICTENNRIEKMKILQPVISKKYINTCLEKYGVKNSFQDESIKQKIMETNLKKYNVKFPQQSKNIRDKSIITYMNKYGVENPNQSSEIKIKIENTCLEKYGVKSPILIPEIIQKRKQACINKYGDEIPLKTELGKETVKQTCLEKYGVEYPQQNPKIAEKTSKNCYRRKTYIFPSGKEILCQGYEPFALDKLVKEDKILEEDIVTGCKNVPTIWYNDADGKKHRHYVDIYIPSQNRCIEIKSIWTAKQNKHNIFLKQNAGKELGYNYEIWIFNSKKELVEVKL
jgi:hypothetical protein